MIYVVNFALVIFYRCAVAYTQCIADKFVVRQDAVTFSKGRELWI
jgi:hypothetical protein